VKFAVLKQWKGTPSKSVELVTRLTGEACGFPFEEKKEYLVYVAAEPKDLQTGICTGTKNLSEAVQEMTELDEIINSLKKMSLRSRRGRHASEASRHGASRHLDS
jgi:hypothetical protein